MVPLEFVRIISKKIHHDSKISPDLQHFFPSDNVLAPESHQVPHSIRGPASRRQVTVIFRFRFWGLNQLLLRKPFISMEFFLRKLLIFLASDSLPSYLYQSL